MINEYYGNGFTTYTTSSGVQYMIHEDDLKELLTESKEYKERGLKLNNLLNEVEELEFTESQISRRNDFLTKVVDDLKKDIQNIKQCDIDFNQHEWGAGTQVLYDNEPFDVVSVDFIEKLIGLESTDDSGLNWVRYENCKLISERG